MQVATPMPAFLKCSASSLALPEGPAVSAIAAIELTNIFMMMPLNLLNNL
jgi:hypothetical protein